MGIFNRKDNHRHYVNYGYATEIAALDSRLVLSMSDRALYNYFLSSRGTNRFGTEIEFDDFEHIMTEYMIRKTVYEAKKWDGKGHPPFFSYNYTELSINRLTREQVLKTDTFDLYIKYCKEMEAQAAKGLNVNDWAELIERNFNVHIDCTRTPAMFVDKGY